MNLKPENKKNKNNSKLNFNIGVIGGDGIGVECCEEAIKVLKLLSKKLKFNISIKNYDWSCKYYLKHKKMMPENGLDLLKQHDSILLGAVGDPRIVPDSISLRGLLLKIRQGFDLYVNLRPGFSIKGVNSPLRGYPENKTFDISIIRENSEGEYSGKYEKIKDKNENNNFIGFQQNSIFTKKGIKRIIEYGFEYAKKNKKTKITLATKSNAIQSFTLWEKIFNEIGNLKYPKIKKSICHIDALAAKLILQPNKFEVIIGSNLFGDILSDILGVLIGSLGFPPSANINPKNRNFPSMFESVSGSAPDIAGKNIANPCATIYAVGLMIDYLLNGKYSNFSCFKFLKKIIQIVCEKKDLNILTPDVLKNSKGTTSTFTNQIISQINQTFDEKYLLNHQ